MSARRCPTHLINYPDDYSKHKFCVCGEQTDQVGSSNPDADWKSLAFDVYFKKWDTDREERLTAELEELVAKTPSIPDPEPS